MLRQWMSTYVSTTTLSFTLFFYVSQCGCDDSLNFMVLGDWGGLPFSPYRTYIEKSVANTMNTIAQERGTKFQLALGDNFYFTGVKDVNDKRFKETFEDVFTGPALQNDWFFVAGNHDWNGNVTAEIEYSKLSPRWNFPSFYYTKSVQSADGATLDIVMIDTIILCGHLSSDFSADEQLKLTNRKAADDQWAWLQKTLASSKADYLLVAGHYPVYSVSHHGPTQCLVDRLRPLLFKYNVTSYICGHDHDLQHLNETQNSQHMDYFVVGAANFVRLSHAHSGDVPPGSLKFYNADSVGGFGLVGFSKQEMKLTFVSGANKELYARTMMPRHYREILV